MDVKRLSVPALLAIIFLGIMLPAWFGWMDLYTQTIVMFIGINIILSSSLNLVNGYMGEFSCGHAGFMAVGAYVSSLVGVFLFAQDTVLGAPLLPPGLAVLLFPLVLLVGAAAAGFAGLLVAVPSFKTRGDYLAIISIAAMYMIKSAIENIDAIGGARGFMGMKKVSAAMDAVFAAPWMLIWVFLATVFTIWILRRFVYSTLGKGVSAVAQDEVAAEIMGVNTNRMKLNAFIISSGLAGLAGGLYAYMLGFVNPGSFNILKSTECLVMVYLGGMGSLSGSVLSAILFTLLLEGLRFVLQWVGLDQVLKWVLIPLLLIALMQFRPEGIMGNRELPDIFPRLRRWYKFK